MKKNNLKQMLAGMFTVLAIVGATMFTVAAQYNNSKTENLISNNANQRPTRCNENTLRGSYGTNISGTFFVPPPAGSSNPPTAVSLASVGRLTFDGAGNVSGTDSNSFGGTFSRSNVTGTYTVASDCTGTLDITHLNGFVITNDIVIVDGGREIYVIQSNPGTVVSGVMKRQ